MTDNNRQQEEILIYLAATENAESDELCAALKSYGYLVKIFSRNEALSGVIGLQEPQALIVDCDAEDGRLAEAVLKNKAESEAFSFPVILIASEDSFERRLEAVRVGIEGYFVKPLNIATLSDRLDDHIK